MCGEKLLKIGITVGRLGNFVWLETCAVFLRQFVASAAATAWCRNDFALSANVWLDLGTA